jgi:prephenate dehydrogenase
VTTPTVLIVGTGLIGGSIGLALREAGAARVTGFDAAPDRARRAAELGALEEAFDQLPPACAAADIVLLATPVGQITSGVRSVAGASREGTIVTDVGSTKGPIVDEAERILGSRRPFVGGHPMAGSEREGIEAARPDLFHAALWILTPTRSTDERAFRTVRDLVGATGAKTIALDPVEHDRLVALVSHLPYAIATALMDLAGAEGDERVFRAAAGSFRDVTRTAGSAPHIWRDILAANREALLRELDAFAGRLGDFRRALADREWETLDGFIARARDARRRLPLKGERGPVSPQVLEIPVPDRTGVLADITTTIGSLGINIEDLRMEHSGEGGVAYVVVDGLSNAQRSADILREQGLRVTISEDR